MSVNLTPFKDRLCAEWRAEYDRYNNFLARSEPFTFQNKQYHFSLYRSSGHLKLQLVPVNHSFTSLSVILTVLVEWRDGQVPFCETLACKRVSGEYLECPLKERFFHRFTNTCSASYFNFIIIFETDPTAANATLPVSTQTKCDKVISNFPSNLENLALDFANLLKNETLPDVKLKFACRKTSIPAHRAVLAARSEVFAAMFSNKMVESRTGDVDVVDVEDDAIDPFLEYVYTGKISSVVPDKVVPGLYAAADKYAVGALRNTCRERMISVLTKENCVDFLTIADAHGDVVFKKSVIEYICSHDAVFSGDAWRKFAKEPSLLAMEIYRSYVDCKTSGIP